MTRLEELLAIYDGLTGQMYWKLEEIRSIIQCKWPKSGMDPAVESYFFSVNKRLDIFNFLRKQRDQVSDKIHEYDPTIWE